MSRQFKPYKSPGTDGIFPCFLQQGIEELTPLIIKLFKCSITEGKLPESWLKVKAVFIPKPGKSDYTIAKSFRPISLMSFLMKTLERLILWHLQDNHYPRNPTTDNLFSYKEGVSYRNSTTQGNF